MITLMKKIKNLFEDKGIDCDISEITDEIVHSMPYVILSPLSEKWEFNMLGNPANKNVRFRIQYYDNHINGNYGEEIESISQIVKEVLKAKELKEEVLNYLSGELKVSFLEENTLILVTFDINLKLHRRSEWE